MRVVVGQLIALVERYPSLVDGAFVIIAWVGLKLGIDYLHETGRVAVEIFQWLSIGLVVIIFLIALVYARIQGPSERVSDLTEKAEEMLEGREN